MAQEITLVLTPTLKKSVQELPEEVQKKFFKQLGFLKANPKHPSLKIHKLNGDWEFYIDFHYRCLFERAGNVYTLHIAGNHKIVDRYKQK